MAKKKRSYRIASLAIYRDSEVASHLRSEVRANLAGEAFELSDALRTPSAAVRAELSGGRRFPTTAKYWERYDAKRLRSSVPLKGESRASATRRAKRAKSYFAQEAQAERTRETVPQWRVALTGTVEVTEQDGRREEFRGTQYGPWRAVPAGGLTDARIKEAYREVARFVVAINARGRPGFDAMSSSGDFATYRKKGKSPTAILYIEHSEIETRDAALGTADEA